LNNRVRLFGRTTGVAFLALAVAALTWAEQKREVTGVLLQVDRENRAISVSCNEIPNYMQAMVMSFAVRDAKLLQGLEPGMAIDFSFVPDKNVSYAEDLRAHPFESLELDPTQARRYKLMEQALATRSSADVLHVGQLVPDFTLTDQTRQRISLSQFTGKVVAITFIYTRCPRPDYCVRLSNNFGLLQRRFEKQMGQNLILLTIVIDPVHDQPEALANYARTWKADARTWHFLTGPLPDIQQLCRKFDMAFYPDEGLLVHSFHTVVVDRKGKLAANLEGNDFSGVQLGDLVNSVLGGPTEPGTK
jgi:protein SCO1/2